jgi:hypothetical protein
MAEAGRATPASPLPRTTVPAAPTEAAAKPRRLTRRAADDGGTG